MKGHIMYTNLMMKAMIMKAIFFCIDQEMTIMYCTHQFVQTAVSSKANGKDFLKLIFQMSIVI